MIDFLADAYSEQIIYENINSEYADMFDGVIDKFDEDTWSDTREAFIKEKKEERKKP